MSFVSTIKNLKSRCKMLEQLIKYTIRIQLSYYSSCDGYDNDEICTLKKKKVHL